MKNSYSKLDDKAIRAFADLMIEKMESLTVSWKQPWINAKLKGRPQNLNGRQYSSSNAFFLYLLCELRHYQTPVYLTFLQAKENNLNINKGAKAFPVVYFDVQVKNIHTGEKITIEEYNELSKEQLADYKVIPFIRQHLVFNVEQTNIKEVRPELWDKLQRKFTIDIPLDTEGMISCRPLDTLIEKQKWLCPIYQEKGNGAYYIPDEIHIPLKSQFKKGESYYATLLHEMTHSTGSEGRLNRSIYNRFGSDEYSHEELIAELTAALVSTSMGITVMPQEKNAAYIKGWCKKINKEPRYILSLLSDVGKAAAMITSVTDKLEMAFSLEKENEEILHPKKVYTTRKNEQLEFSFAEEIVSSHQELREKMLSKNFRNLQKGEFCKVERIFEESTSFSFTSGERIETMEDVAYIFRKLEDAAVENIFAVLVKDQTPIVLHLGMGTYTQTILNIPAITTAVNRINPDTVYFVHNHPSGNINASHQDIKIWTTLKKILGDKLMPGIIINLKSGHFGLFNEKVLPSLNTKKDDSIINEIPLKLFSFSKQVFEPDYDPGKNIIRSSQDVASFVSSQRLGDRKKINTLILNNAAGIVANIFTPFTSIDSTNVEDVAKSLINEIALSGGTKAIVYGDFKIDNTLQKLASKIKEYTSNEFQLLDSISIKGNHSTFLSAVDEGLLCEEKIEYEPNRKLKKQIFNNLNQIKMEQNIKKVDLLKVDWDALKTKFGITKEELEEKSVLDEMIHFKKSGQLLKVMYESTTGMKEFDARIQFRDTKEGYTLKFYPVRQTPELDKPYLGYTFTDEDKTILLQTGHLGKLAKIQPYNSTPKEAFISLDPLTNEVVHVDKDRIKLNNTFCKAVLTENELANIMNGKAVYIKDMESKAGKKFNAFLQIDANKKGLAIVSAPKIEIDINKVTEIHRVKVTEEQKEMLKKGGSIFLDNLQTSDGKSYSAEISFSEESKTFKYNFPLPEHAFSKEQKTAIERGEKVLVTGLKSQKGTTYDAFFYKNKETGRIEKVYPVKDSVMGVKLSDEQKINLQNGKYVWIDGLKRIDGTTFKAPVVWNDKKGKFAFAERKEVQKEDTHTLPQQKENRQEENTIKRGRKM